MANVDVLEEVAMKHQLIRVTGIFCLLLLAVTATAGTWSTNNFFYQPSLEARGATEKNNFDTGLNRVDAHLGKYKTLGDPSYSTLAEALTTIGSNSVTLTIPAGTVAIASNTTIGSNIALRVFKGGQFNVNGGITLTINGPIDAGPYQIFSGTGTVTLGGVSTIYDVWYAVPPSNPEGNIAAPIGSRFIKTAGSAPLVYVKQSGTGTTGWVASSGGSGATAFTGLTDVPSTYSGQAGKSLRVNPNSDGLEYYAPSSSGGVRPFITFGEDGYATISQALTAIGSTATTLVIPAEAGAVPITSNTTIPANVDLRILKGGRFDIANGVTLTINAPIEAGPYQIFSWTGTGAINLKSSPTKECYLQWWGAQPGLTNDISASLLKAYQSLTIGQSIRVTNDVWRLAAPMEYVPAAGWTSCLESLLLPDLVGDSNDGSVIFLAVGGSNDGITIGGYYNGYEKWVQGCHIKNLTFLGDTAACRHALNLRLWNHHGGTEKINLFCGSTDAAVRLAQVENGRWEFNLGYGYVKYNGTIPYAQMKNGVLVEPEPGGWGLGAGTFNHFKVQKTFSAGCTYGLKMDTSSGFVDAGDIETCVDGDVQSHYNGLYDQSPNYQIALYNGGATRIAQTFTLSQPTLIRNIGVVYDLVGSPRGPVNVKIYNTSGGVPTGSPIYTSWRTKQASDANGGLPFFELFEVGNQTLAAGTYAASLEFAGGDASNYINADVDTAGGGPGTCYTYSGGSWHAQTYTMRHVINANASVWLYNCTDVHINSQHIEGSWVGYAIDNCRNIEIDNTTVGGDIRITRSSNIKLSGTNNYLRIITDPVSSIVLEDNYSPPFSDSMQDYGDTLYTGRIKDWLHRVPPDIKGNNPLNYCPNHLLDRWRSDRPDSFAGGWQKDADMTWTWCGDGKTDTTRHKATPYCAKLVKTTSGSWEGPKFVADNDVAPFRGHHITASIYMMMPSGQSFNNNNFMNISVSLPAWASSTSYRIGDGMSYGDVICVVPGTSGGSQPNWGSYNDGDYIIDGTVVWLKWLRWGQSGGNIDGSWSDNQWHRIAAWRFIPLNTLYFSVYFQWYIQAGGGANTCYFALPCINFGTILSRPVMPSPNEAASYFTIGGCKFDRGTAPPSNGEWCNKGDTRFNSSATPGQPSGWVCTTSGTAGSGAVWKALGNLAN
jgi:hypothetical protein